MKYYLLLFCVLASFERSYSQEVISLEEAIQIAIENNYNIKIASNNVKKAKKQHHIGNAGMLPEVSFSGSRTISSNITERKGENNVTGNVTNFKFGPNETKALQLSGNLNQTLFDGLAMFKTYDQLGLSKELQSLNRQGEIENVISQVIVTYFSILTNKNLVNTNKQAIAFSKETLELAKKRKNSGSAIELDILNAKADLANDSSALLESERQLNQNIASLNYIISLPVNQREKEFYDTVILDNTLLNELNIEAVSSNILVKQSLETEKITELDYQIFKANKLPRLSLNAGYNRSFSETPDLLSENLNKTWSVAIRANYTLFQGFKRNIQIQTAKIDQLNQELQTNEIKQRVSRDFITAKQNLKTRTKQYALEKRNLEIFEENYESSKKSYEYGQINSNQLREAQLNLIQAKRRLFEAKVNAKLEEIELLRLTGNLLSFNQ